MKVTLRQLQEGSKLSLAECLKMEYRLTQRCMVSFAYSMLHVLESKCCFKIIVVYVNQSLFKSRQSKKVTSKSNISYQHFK